MLSPRSRIDADGERGATVVIVALSLVAMFGMIVLVVDVGGLLWKRRELVNGSDAAALSAASTCAVKSTVDPRTAETAADQLAAENVTGLDPTTSTNATVAAGTCHATTSGWVKVQYSQQQHLFFAPVLGFPNQNGVTTKATAIWGIPGSAAPLPITIYSSSIQSSCDIQSDPPPTDCYFWFDNNGFGTSRFGLLDLNPYPTGGWDITPASAKCPGTPGTSVLKSWIDGSATADVKVHYPLPTYVCVRGGAISQADQNAIWGSLKQRVGDILTFPINRCFTSLAGNLYGQVDQNGNQVVCTDGSVDKYDIIGFVDFQLTAVLQGQAEWGGIRPTACSNNNYGPVSKNQTISLLTLGSPGQCPPPTQTNVTIDPTTLLVGPKGGVAKGPTDPTRQYDFNPTNNTILWKGNPGNLTIQFTWWVNGLCGPPPSNGSAVCITVKTVQVRVGGSGNLNGSPLSNLRGVKLCDPTIAGSCDPVNVPNP
jgi:hypothetical protein